MQTGQEYWKDWIGYWGFISEQAAQRWFKASDRLRKEEYKLESFYSDVFGFWTDSTMAFLAACRGPVRSPQPVIFRLDPNDSVAGPKYIPIFAPCLPNADPSFVWLDCRNPEDPAPKHPVEWRNLRLRFTENKSELEIKLLGLKPPLTPATYRAIVHLEEVPLAEVLIVVRDSREWGDHPSNVHASGDAAKEGAAKQAAAKEAAAKEAAAHKTSSHKTRRKK